MVDTWFDPETDRLLSVDDVATILGVPKQTLYTWRTRRPVYGPVAIKVGKYIRYRRADVTAWIDAQAAAAA